MTFENVLKIGEILRRINIMEVKKEDTINHHQEKCVSNRLAQAQDVCIKVSQP